MARRKGNKIAPGGTTDDYDSTDHAPHPYHMMMDVRGGVAMERKVMGSRGGSRMKHGRSQRGRPFSRDHGRQSTLGVSGRRSRGVAADVQRELAWMDTPGGVQLMRIQVHTHVHNRVQAQSTSRQRLCACTCTVHVHVQVHVQYKYNMPAILCECH